MQCTTTRGRSGRSWAGKASSASSRSCSSFALQSILDAIASNRSSPMIVQVANTNAPPRNLLRSTGAVLAGMVAVIALSLGTDQLLHVLDVYPPWGQAMYEPGLNILALSYRCVYNVVGACITARLAPRNPLRHLWVFALIGVALGTAGAIATIPMNL